MTVHAYPRARNVTAIAADVLLVAVLIAAVALDRGTLGRVLAVAIVMVLAVSIATLHHPRRVELDDTGIRFCAYGRSHRFEWAAVERVHVRRFVTGDRVLVRLAPTPPWRGRYWIHETIGGYRTLLDALERRTAATPRGAGAPSS